MKRFLQGLTFAALAFAATMPALAEHLVILHTNDTHSQIDPIEGSDLGGVLRRKVVVDSVRAAEKNVLLIDAGDVVQGTLYFTRFNGIPEHIMMNELGYDIAIPGNHEFDNDSEDFAKLIKMTNAKYLSSNYVIESGTPLDGLLEKYDIREIGGRKIGFIGLNIDPDGMFSRHKGVKYVDNVQTAETLAWMLKNLEGCDMVIAITHIGLDESGTGDINLVSKTSNIDLVIGGHSHDQVYPGSPEGFEWQYPNKDGRMIPVLQMGKSGAVIGKIDIDLDNLAINPTAIKIDSRLDDRLDQDAYKWIESYHKVVDELMHNYITTSDANLGKIDLVNGVSDIIMELGKKYSGRKIDLALLNNGGVRNDIPKGKVSEGHVEMVFPFKNYITVVEVKGDKLAKIFDQLQTKKITGVSSNVRATYDPNTLESVEVLIDGKPIDPSKTYTIATIDYLSDVGDKLFAFEGRKELYRSESTLLEDLLDYIVKNKYKFKGNPSPRVYPAE